MMDAQRMEIGIARGTEGGREEERILDDESLRGQSSIMYNVHRKQMQLLLPRVTGY
jgi:hypothetical protein